MKLPLLTYFNSFHNYLSKFKKYKSKRGKNQQFCLFLFPWLKIYLKGKKFQDVSDIKSNTSQLPIIYKEMSQIDLVWFYGISTIVGYLVPNPFLYI